MIQEALNIVFILIYFWQPSYSSFCYLLTGSYLWLSCTYFAGSSRLVYKSSVYLSLIFLCIKSLLLVGTHFIDYLSILTLYPQVFSSFGMTAEDYLPYSLIHLIPDAAIFIISLFSYFLASRGLNSYISTSVNWYSGIFAIWLCSCSMYNLPSIFYNIFLLYWAITQGVMLKVVKLNVFSGVVSALTMTQIFASFIVSLLKIDLGKWMVLGVVKVPSYEIGVLVFGSLVFSSIKREHSSRIGEELSQPLLAKEPTLIMEACVLLMYLLVKFGVFLWIELNPGFIGLFLLIWIGFVLLESDVIANMKMIKHLLIPLITFSYFLDYLYCIYTSTYSYNHYFMLMTIILASYLYKMSPIISNPNYSLPATWYGKIISIVISHTYLFSLIALFTIGLSAINLLHTGLMILCLNYMSDIKHVKENWSLLIYYMIFFMFIREAWVDLKPIFPAEIRTHYFVKFIGLDSETNDKEYTDEDGLNWVLLACCSLQLFANRYNFGEKLETYTNFVFDLLSEAYRYFSNIEFWLIYIVLFFVSFFRDANLLNFIRCLILIYIITKHLASPYTKINSNFAKLNSDLRFLKVYCMMVLGVRYIYQFLQTFKQAPKFAKIGLEVYEDTQNLYYGMASDTILVVSSVLAHRSNTYWIRNHDENGNRKSELHSGKAELKEKGKFKYSLFYNVFSRPFQYILLTTIGAMCVFWRLSISMFIYLLIVCLYHLRVSYRFYAGCASARAALNERKEIAKTLAKDEKKEFENLCSSQKPVDLRNLRISEWQIRAFVWRCLFVWTCTCLLMSYLRYFGTLEIVKLDEYLEALYFVFGFSNNNEYFIIAESFGYFCIFGLLIIERQCLQYNMPKELKTKEDGWVFDVVLRIGRISMNYDFLKIKDFEMQEKNVKVDHAQRFNKRSSTYLRQMTQIESSESYESIKKKINFISALNLVKVIAEVLIPMFLLLLSFNKLTIVSTIYVFSVFLILLVNKQKQTILLNFIIVFCILVQYGMILSNFSAKVAPQNVPQPIAEVLQSLGVPWMVNVNWYSKQADMYFNMGTSSEQLNSIFFDFLIEIFVLVYWFYLSKREVQLAYLVQKLPKEKKIYRHEEELLVHTNFKAKIKVFLYEIKLLFYKFARFSIVIIVLLFTTQGKGVLSLLYSLFCIIFLFNENLIILRSFNRPSTSNPPEQKSISPQKQSKYSESPEKSSIQIPLKLLNKNPNSVTIAQVSLEQLNEPINKEATSGIKSYLNLLKYFLILISFDLLLQIVIQTPFIDFNEENSAMNLTNLEGWFSDFGVSKLWGGNIIDLEARFSAIWFKIFTFAILLVVEAMMKSKDFQVSHNKHCKIIQQESEEISLKMAHEFNRQRVQTNFMYLKRKKKFNQYVLELEKNINEWNQNFKKPSKIKGDSVVGEKSEEEIHDFKSQEIVESEKMVKNSKIDKLKSSVKNVMKMIHLKKTIFEEPKNQINLGIKFHVKEETKNTSRIINSLVKNVNPYLFGDFIKKVTILSSTLPDRNLFLAKTEKVLKLKNRFYGIRSDLNESFADLDNTHDEKVTENEETQQIDQENEYEVRLKDFPQLICYVLASNTQSLVYILFLINHFKYANLESLVFPMSLFGYAMLEFPRPRIKYFRIMLVYTSCVLLFKFLFQLKILKRIDFIKQYKDPYTIGFKPVPDSEFLNYILWDALLLFCLLCREYYMIRIGMWEKIETDIESLEEAKIRLKISKKDVSSTEEYPSVTEIFKKSEKKSIKRALSNFKNQKSNPSFTERLIPKNPGEKPGRDFYLFTFMMQLLILVYLFFFFNKLEGLSEDISTSLQANQFQGRMVVSIIIVVILIIFDRYVYIQHTTIALSDSELEEIEYMKNYRRGKSFTKALSMDESLGVVADKERSSQVDIEMRELEQRFREKCKNKERHEKAIKQLLIIKLVLHSILLFVVHAIIFWYFPYISQAPFTDNKNFYLQIFYVLYVIYITFEAQQFRLGLPSFTEISFPLMRSISPFSSGAFKIYKGMPFLYELRTCVDWTFTNTALNIYQWLKLEQIEAQLFYNECSQKSLKYKKHGDKIQKFEKFQYGCCSLFIILLIILLPLFIFSTLNPIIEPNRVLSAGLTIKLVIGERAFKIYSLSTADTIMQIDYDYFVSRGFDKSEEIKLTDFKVMQKIDMPQSADVNWDITSYTKNTLKARLETIKSSQSYEDPFKLVMEARLLRKYPQKLPEVSIIKEKPLSISDAQTLYGMIFHENNESLTVVNFTNKVFRLPSAGGTITPFSYTKDNYVKNLTLHLIHDDSGLFWNVSSESFHDSHIGLRLYVLSDNYSPVTFNFSIITFYISIVFLAGKLIRMVTVGSGLNIVMTDMKNSEHLRTLCSAVYISRMTGKLLKEEELYFELIDILRSPEFTKVLTGSSSIKAKKD